MSRQPKYELGPLFGLQAARADRVTVKISIPCAESGSTDQEIEEFYRFAASRGWMVLDCEVSAPPGRPRSLDAKTITRIQRLSREGHACAVIAEKLGLSGSTVWRALGGKDGPNV